MKKHGSHAEGNRAVYLADKLLTFAWAVALGAVPSGCLAASSDIATPKGAPINEDGLRQLTTAEIRQLIVGKTVVPDGERVRLHAGASSDHFEQNGTVFVRNQNRRSHRRYRITADQVCIEIADDPRRLCNYFYRSSIGKYYRGNLSQQRIIEPILVLE